jgi:hypothetical protein
MNKVMKIIVVIIIVDLVVFGGYFAYKLFLKGDSKDNEEVFEWVTVDENYYSEDAIEEYIKNESSAQGLLPVSIKNYGKNKKVLKKFKGTKLAGPNEFNIKMVYSDMEDWKLIELKYKDSQDREVHRTILYIYTDGEWIVGDTGSLMDN